MIEKFIVLVSIFVGGFVLARLIELWLKHGAGKEAFVKPEEYPKTKFNMLDEKAKTTCQRV